MERKRKLLIYQVYIKYEKNINNDNDDYSDKIYNKKKIVILQNENANFLPDKNKKIFFELRGSNERMRISNLSFRSNL